MFVSVSLYINNLFPVIRCPDPPEIGNSTCDVTGLHYTDNVTYTCLPGYAKNPLGSLQSPPEDIITVQATECLVDGTWSTGLEDCYSELISHNALLSTSQASSVNEVYMYMFLTKPKGMLTIFPQCSFFTGISRNFQSKFFMLSLTGCVWEFQNNALWYTH